MKNIFFLTILLFFSCEKKNTGNLKEPKKAGTVQKEIEKLNLAQNLNDSKKVDNWQDGFGLTHNIDKDSIWNRPVKYYLENKNCSQTAIDFYFGKYRPTDEPKTAELLGLVLTEKNDLRPFYRWILNKTIIIQDGALGEYTGQPARKYAERFPKEFFEYMDFDKSGQKYEDWCNSILYSGFYEIDDAKKPQIIRENMTNVMTENCKDCNQETLKRIIKFTHDCFPDSEN